MRNALAAWTISQAGNEAQTQRYLAGPVDGSLRAAFAVQDEQGWSPEGWTSPTTGAPVRKRNVEGALDAHMLIVGLAGPGLGVALRDAVAVAGADRSAPRDRWRT